MTWVGRLAGVSALFGFSVMIAGVGNASCLQTILGGALFWVGILGANYDRETGRVEIGGGPDINP